MGHDGQNKRSAQREAARRQRAARKRGHKRRVKLEGTKHDVARGLLGAP